MGPLDVISLADAKEHLVVDFPDNDVSIERNIKTAIALVEQYTCYKLYERSVTYTMPLCGHKEVYDYPLSITAGQPVKIYDRVLSTIVSAASGYGVTAAVGYSDVADIPSPLIDGAYKIIEYLYENKDIYEANLPLDVQLILNPYRRSATII